MASASSCSHSRSPSSRSESSSDESTTRRRGRRSPSSAPALTGARAPTDSSQVAYSSEDEVDESESEALSSKGRRRTGGLAGL